MEIVLVFLKAYFRDQAFILTTVYFRLHSLSVIKSYEFVVGEFKTEVNTNGDRSSVYKMIDFEKCKVSEASGKLINHYLHATRVTLLSLAFVLKKKRSFIPNKHSTLLKP